MRLYLDANAIIYSIEGAPPFRDAVLSWIGQARSAPNGQVLTSRLSRLECRSKPLKANDARLLTLYDALFGLLRITEIGEDLIEHATALRARFDLRSADAIHLTTAIIEKADVFLSGDKQLARCTAVKVVVLG